MWSWLFRINNSKRKVLHKQSTDELLESNNGMKLNCSGLSERNIMIYQSFESNTRIATSFMRLNILMNTLDNLEEIKKVTPSFINEPSIEGEDDIKSSNEIKDTNKDKEAKQSNKRY